MKITDRLGLLSHKDICLKLYQKYNIQSVVDLGAGSNPQFDICHQLNIRQLLIDIAYPEFKSERIWQLSMNITDLTQIEVAILNFCGVEDRTAIVSIQNLEHLTTADGLRLLDFLENSNATLLVIETPNGFVHQLPTSENPFQQHLSGWTVRDFKRLGFKVRGTSGLKILHNNFDKGSYKFKIRGMKLLDVILSRILFVQYFPRIAFNIIAYKIK